jgi:hypothetical protein
MKMLTTYGRHPDNWQVKIADMDNSQLQKEITDTEQRITKDSDEITKFGNLVENKPHYETCWKECLETAKSNLKSEQQDLAELKKLTSQ